MGQQYLLHALGMKEKGGHQDIAVLEIQPGGQEKGLQELPARMLLQPNSYFTFQANHRPL